MRTLAYGGAGFVAGITTYAIAGWVGIGCCLIGNFSYSFAVACDEWMNR